MTRSATAVIGSNWGDEGKGLVVDALSVGSDTVVVRFNGGAQAGHTVVTPDGKRHVFHHHGAGTFRGAATYLSEHFILNPILYAHERIALDRPRVMASLHARVTTPYDMMLNQWAEEDRGTARHGSCGLGINETIVRHEAMHIPWALSYGILDDIRYEYVPERADQLGVVLTSERQGLLESERIIERFIEAYDYMQDTITWCDACDVTGDIIFEGAQGLLLDQDAPGFPYVTRSKTGLYNVRELCEQMKIEEIDAVFVTRTYATRHGAGPMPDEDASMQFPDATNVPNPWQQTLRFGKLDVQGLYSRIVTELYNGSGVAINPIVAMTCVDQMDNEELRNSCLFMLYESHGPTRNTFHQYATKVTR